MRAPAPSFGRWVAEEHLGAGGMGEVWRVRDPATGERAALKTTQLRPGLVESFRREVAVLARLEHPAVVRVLDAGVADGVPWYAMELVEGVTLRQQVSTWTCSTATPPARGAGDTLDLDAMDDVPVDDGPPAAPGVLPDVLALAWRIAAALAWLHGEGLIHGDLKPENVLLRPDGRPVLVDFGLAARFASAGREVLDLGQGGGTVAYMAPEQIRGEPLDGRADLYALGVMLFEALVGERPFSGAPRAVLEMHLSRPPIAPSARVPALPPEVDDLILKLLAKPRRARFQRATDLLCALEALGASPEPWPAPRVALVRPTFVGRDDALRDAHGRMVLVGGPPGVGRTRFALEAALTGAEGATVLAASGGGPLGPLGRIVATLADRCAEVGPEEVERVIGPRAAILAPFVPELAALPGARVPLAELPASASRERTCRALGEVLEAAGRDRPLLLVLDDLHAAGELTFGFLAGLLEAAPARVRVLGTADTDRAPERLRALMASPRLTALSLAPLADEHLAGIAAELAGRPIDGVQALAAGRPLVAAEAARLAIERPDEPPPATLEELVARRLDALGPLAAWVHLAALDGERVDPARLGAALGDPLSPLARLEREGWLEGEPLRFASETMRRAVVSSLPERERRALHARLAAVPDDDPARRAGHLAASGETDGARPWWLRAARAAMARGDLVEGLAHWRSRADGAPLDLDLVLDRQQVGFALAAGAGRFDEALAEARGVVDGARALDRPDLEADGLRMEGVACWNLGRAEEARAAYEASIALAAAIGDDRARARALTDLGVLDQDQGRTEIARERYRTAIALLDGRDRRAEAVARINLAGLDADAGRSQEAVDGHERALVAVREAGDARLEGIVLGNLGNALADLGRPEEARRAYAQSLGVHRAIGNRRSEAVALLNVAILDAEAGRPGAAREAFAEALQIHRQLGNRRFVGLVHLYRARAEIRAAGAGAAEDLDAAEEQLRAVGDRSHLVLVACERGHLALARGEDPEPWLAEAERRAEGLGALVGDPVEALRRAIRGP